MKHAAALLCLATLPLSACGDGGLTSVIPEPTFDAALLVNSIDNSLSVLPLDEDEGQAFTVGLGPSGSPVTLAARGELVVVPLGGTPALAVVDLAERALARTVALPENSGATGAAFLDDSTVVVAHSNLNSVSVVNVLRGTVGTPIAVGQFPQRVLAANDTVWVVNAELVDFQPTGPGTISVLTGSPLAVVRTIQLGAVNPGGAALSHSALYVVGAGSFGGNDGSLSTVHRGTGEETRHDPGFGEFPGAVALLPDGTLAVSSFSYGMAVWNPATGTFVHAPTDPVRPGGATAIAGLGVAPDGRLWAVEGQCGQPGRAFILDSGSLAVLRTVTVGTCPFGVVFAEVPE
ncbi:MAG: hypothetical protein WEB88_16675 [Gemmatimonadota bacterium]